ncbi:acyltransferase family protein [Acidimicrobiaceae bacterium USS-CC1]|uniref:Acyltransferase family protein n=1 Tax=Acidiferrimicrobium australe TaxID=2664430 RepID=A0ABW9QSL9_9ACTN|nr:acyltransferase family protein [Acidiferrimicrobium australe]
MLGHGAPPLSARGDHPRPVPAAQESLVPCRQRARGTAPEGPGTTAGPSGRGVRLARRRGSPGRVAIRGAPGPQTLVTVTAPDRPDVPAPAAAGGRSIGAAFDPRRNARDLLRLVLALLVVVSHALVLGRHRSEVLWRCGTLGGIAVDVFFAISGYLIAASAAHDHVGRYLWQRFLRIFPGFWACLAVTAVVAGPVAWIASGRPFGACGAPSGPPHDRAGPPTPGCA